MKCKRPIQINADGLAEKKVSEITSLTSYRNQSGGTKEMESCRNTIKPTVCWNEIRNEKNKLLQLHVNTEYVTRERESIEETVHKKKKEQYAHSRKAR